MKLSKSKKYSQSLGDYKRRVHKVFETANIKIDSVVSDLFGVTGRNLIELLCHEESNISLEAIEECSKGSLKSKVPELYNLEVTVLKITIETYTRLPMHFHPVINIAYMTAGEHNRHFPKGGGKGHSGGRRGVNNSQGNVVYCSLEETGQLDITSPSPGRKSIIPVLDY